MNSSSYREIRIIEIRIRESQLYLRKTYSGQSSNNYCAKVFKIPKFPKYLTKFWLNYPKFLVKIILNS